MKLLIIFILAGLSTQAQTPQKGKGVHIDSTTGKFYTVTVPDTGIAAIKTLPQPALVKRRKK